MPWLTTLRVTDEKGHTVKTSETLGMLRPTVNDMLSEASITLDRIGAAETLREGVKVSIVATYKRHKR
jgi:hypothetical protein